MSFTTDGKISSKPRLLLYFKLFKAISSLLSCQMFSCKKVSAEFYTLTCQQLYPCFLTLASELIFVSFYLSIVIQFRLVCIYGEIKLTYVLNYWKNSQRSLMSLELKVQVLVLFLQIICSDHLQIYFD